MLWEKRNRARYGIQECCGRIYFSLGFNPPAESEARTWKWVVYLGGDPRKQNEGVGKVTRGEKKGQERTH